MAKTKKIKRIKAWGVICTTDRGRLAGQGTYTIVENEREAQEWVIYFQNVCQASVAKKKRKRYKVVPVEIIIK